MSDLRTPVQVMVARARRYAALSAEFSPKEAFVAEDRADPDVFVEAASALAIACDTDANPAGLWLMRTTERRYELAKLHEEARLHLEVDERRRRGADEEAGDLLDALVGAPPFSLAEIGRRINGPESRRDLERIILALDRAGPAAPGYQLLEPARLALYAWDRRQRNEQLVKAGFVGRDEERGLLADWISNPTSRAPVRALFLTGLPGVGKSWLLEEAVRAAHKGSRDPITVRLDFDRAGLDILDLFGLTMEVARQVAERVGQGGDLLLKRRLDTASVDLGLTDGLQKRNATPRPLAAAIGQVVRADGRPILFVLDTLEVLRARGDTHPKRLFEWLDELVGHGVAPVSIIAAGRGDALDSCSERVAARRHLEGLEPGVSRQLLERIGIDPNVAPEVARIADGNPLRLRLAAKLVERIGGAFAEEIQGGVSSAYLYRFLLSRIIDPDLRKLVHPGLVVRRINPEAIGRVLAPNVGLGRILPHQAEALFEALKAEHWLIEADPEMPGWLRHRSDMRRTFLPMLYKASPDRCARLDAAASRWFADRPESWCAVEAAYHRLQLMRADGAVPEIDPAVAAQFEIEMLDELPEKARNLVLAARGARTEQARRGSLAQGFDRGLADELVAVVNRSDFIEGRHIVDRAIERGLDPLHPAAEAVRAFYWRSGRWSEARDWLRRRDRLTSGDADLADLTPELRSARLEMRAEFDFARLDRLLGQAPDQCRFALESSLPAEETRAFGGALVIAGLERLPDFEGGSLPIDAVGAAREHWAGQGRPLAAHARGFERLSTRLMNRLDIAASDLLARGPAGVARILSVDVCFEGFADNLDKVWRSGRLDERAAAADERLADQGGLLPAGLAIGLRPPLPARPIGGLAAMGLLAEWMEAEGFLSRDGDLRLIGQSAARWRRAMSGQWPFPGRRRRWPRPPLDETIEDRVDQLAAEGDPTGAARAQLQLWCAEEPGPLLATLAARLARPILAVAMNVPPTSRSDLHARGRAAAAGLVRRQVPAAFVPALATLIVHGELPGRSGR